MLHPGTELRYIDDHIGYGVFAKEPISAGTLTWVLDPFDRKLPPTAVSDLGDAHTPMLEKYGYLNAKGECVLCWDFTRYMNHSCDANVFSPGLECELAVRDIRAGERAHQRLWFAQPGAANALPL